MIMWFTNNLKERKFWLNIKKKKKKSTKCNGDIQTKLEKVHIRRLWLPITCGATIDTSNKVTFWSALLWKNDEQSAA